MAEKRVEKAEKNAEKRVEKAEKNAEKQVEKAEKNAEKQVEELKEQFKARETLWNHETSRLQQAIVETKRDLLSVQYSKSALTFDRSFVESTSWAFAARDSEGNVITSVTEGSKAFVNKYVLQGSKLCEKAQDIFNVLKSKKGFTGITEKSIVKELQDIYHVTSKEIHYPTNPKLKSGIYAGSGSLVTRAAVGVFITVSQQKKYNADAIQLLNGNDEVACTIEKGKLR